MKESLSKTLLYASLMSLALWLLIETYPEILVSIFTDDLELKEIASQGMRIYLLMIPLVGAQTIASQYFQGVEKPRLSTLLMMLRYGVILVPSIAILGPQIGIKGIYMSNAISDGLASSVAIFFILKEIRSLANKGQRQDIN